MEEDGHLLNDIITRMRARPYEQRTQLLSFLLLFGCYRPEAYLLLSECVSVVGAPEPVQKPSFEARMQPYTAIICISDEKVSVPPCVAVKVLEGVLSSGVTRSNLAKKLIRSRRYWDKPSPHSVEFIKDLLIKREMTKKGKGKFSKLIQDILTHENLFNAVSVLKTASEKFRNNSVFPQTISRLYYTNLQYDRAEGWASEAIRRFPDNSYVADTMGQIFKNKLLRSKQLDDVLEVSDKAIEAFREVERKADRELDPEMMDAAAPRSISDSYNNRGRFGFMQVAKILYEKLPDGQLRKSRVGSMQSEVTERFEFFEWYLTYSKPTRTTSEPHYFWKDVAICYQYYSGAEVAASSSFAGLLEHLNQGLFTSRRRRAGLGEKRRSVSDMRKNRAALKKEMEESGSEETALRLVLSNMVLSRRSLGSPPLSPLAHLQRLMLRLMDTHVGRRSPEFYLLLLMLFWPQEQEEEDEGEEEEEDEEEEDELEEEEEDEEEEDEVAVEEDEEEEDDVEEEEEENSAEGGEAEALTVIPTVDLEMNVRFMEEAFQRGDHAKYLRGRYLLPLFFLGARRGGGGGLTRWLHRSKLDKVVEQTVDVGLAQDHVYQSLSDKEKEREKGRRIGEMWRDWQLWRLPEVRALLRPVRTQPCQSDQHLLVRVGGKTIRVALEEPAPPGPGTPSPSTLTPPTFFLAFNIKGPVVFKA